jgi:hypothetical protein
MKPKYLIEFDKALNECRELYKGPESDIGNFIYRDKANNKFWGPTHSAKECLYRIKRGIAIKREV